MTNEEAINHLGTYKFRGLTHTVAEFIPPPWEWQEAMEMAISALREQEGKGANVRTNADHIRHMTDEELGDFLDGIYCHGWNYGSIDRFDDDPDYHNWLKQPYEESEH